MRSRHRGQSVVEFGIIALLFTLLMFAIVDLGLLLNSWVRLSSGARDIGRAASVGHFGTDLSTMAKQLVLPGVSATPYSPFVKYCCGESGSNDELVISVQYYNGDPTLPPPAPCIPGASGCSPVPPSAVDNRYWGGTCPTGPACTHPRRGDMIVVSLSAPGMEVLTPLVRPFFNCPSSQLHCNVKLGSTAMMRYEGQ